MRRAMRRGPNVTTWVALIAACLLLSAVQTRSASAVPYTWSSATTGGLWSGTANWTPNALSGGPTSGDTVVLNTTSSDTSRTVTIDSTAWGAATSGTITSLTLTQTNSGTNTLDIGKNLRVLNAVALEASNGGSARLTISPQSSSSVTGTFSGGLTLNPGGVLSLGFTNPSGTFRYQGEINGSVTVGGGLLDVSSYVRNGTATGSQQNTITGNLAMSSGTVFINSIPSGLSPGSDTDRRLRVTGSLSITGGIVQTATTNGGLYLDGATNTFQPASIVGTPSLTLQGSVDQSLLTNQITQITVRGSGVKTASSSLAPAGGNLGNLILADNNTATASSRTTFRLGSDLTLQSGRSLPTSSNLSNVEPTTLRVDIGIDAASYVLDLTGNSGVFQPNSPFAVGTGTTTYWAFTGTTGRIIANGFNFTTGANDVATTVGPGLILESRSGNNVANNLGLKSGTGTLAIDPSSTFVYSGAAAAATPSTLTSNRAIGNVEVASGALRILSLPGLQALRVTGGTLDLGGNSLIVVSGSFGGGTVQSGTLSTAGLFSASSGTISAALVGSGSFAKVGSGTATLSGTNSYVGTTTVSDGVLIVTSSAALPGIVSPGGFAVAAGATLEVTSGVDTVTVEGMLGTGNFAAGAFAEVDTAGADRTLSAAIGGLLGLRKSGGNTLTLTGSSTYSGGTVIAGGTLRLGTGGSITGGVVNQGSLAFDRADAVTLSGPISGIGGLVQSSTIAAGVVTLTGTNSYTGLTTVTSGSLVVEGDHSAATGGWWLQNSPTNLLNKSVTFAAGAVVVTATDKTVQVGNFATSGSNNAILTVLGSSTNAGGLNIGRFGTLTVGSGGVWLQSGTMQVTPGAGGSANLTVNAGGLFTYTNATTIPLNSSSNSSGNGTITIAGGTFVTAAGFEQFVSSTTTGVPTLALSGAGVLRLLQDVPLLTTPIASGSGNLLRMTLGSGGGVVNTDGFGTVIGVVISGAGSLTKAGLGTLTLSGSNTYTGDTIVSAGTLTLGTETTLQTSAVDVAPAGILSFGSLSAASLAGLKGSGNVTLENASLDPVALSVGATGSSSTYAGVLAGAGGLTKAGAGTFTLTGSNTYSGGTTIAGGTMQIGSGGTSGSIEGAVTTHGTLAFSRSDNVVFSDAIGGSGGVVQSGSGRLTLSASNSYLGGMTVVGSGTMGSLQITNVSALGTGTLTLRTSRNDTLNAFEIATSGTIINPINIDMAGSGRNNIAATSGSAVLAGPIAILGTANRTQIFYSNGGGFEIRGNLTGTAFASLLSFRGSGATGVISGTVSAPNATFEVNGTNAASWLVTSTGNVWASTQVGATGSFLVGADDALATGAKVFWYQTPTGGVNLNGFSQTVAGLDSGTTAAGSGRVTNNSVSSDSTLTLAGLAANYEYRGLLTNGTNGRSLALSMNSPGRVQTLAGSSSYTGGTTIVAGTIALGHANGLGGGGPLAVNGGGLDLRGVSPTVGALSGSAGGVITSSTAGAATFTVSSDSDSTFAGLIENGLGTVGLTKTGGGKLTLTAAQTYTGPTNVDGGTLAVNGSLASTVTVSAGGELGGAGSVGTISGGGLVGPGNSPGILEAPGVNPAGGLSFAFEFTQAAPNYGSPTASANDVLWLTGSTAFGSSLSSANSVSIYLTPDLLALESLTGGFFTDMAGDFLASISQATFQYFVQDEEGDVIYNELNYRPLLEYDPSKSFTVSTVAENSGQVMQLVVVPEPGALLLAGVGVAAAAWAARCRRPAAG